MHPTEEIVLFFLKRSKKKKLMQMIKVRTLPWLDGPQNSERRQNSQIVLSTAMYSL